MSCLFLFGIGFMTTLLYLLRCIYSSINMSLKNLQNNNQEFLDQTEAEKKVLDADIRADNVRFLILDEKFNNGEILTAEELSDFERLKQKREDRAKALDNKYLVDIDPFANDNVANVVARQEQRVSGLK